MSCLGEEIIFSFLVLIFSPILLGILFRKWKVLFMTILFSIVSIIANIILNEFNITHSFFWLYTLVLLVPVFGIIYGVKLERKKHKL